MAQEAKTIAAQPDSLSSIPVTHKLSADLHKWCVSLYHLGKGLYLKPKYKKPLPITKCRTQERREKGVLWDMKFSIKGAKRLGRRS